MSNNQAGEQPQSKATVVLAALFLAALCVAGIWGFNRGPDPNSWFVLLRSDLGWKAVFGGGAVVFGAFAVYGFMRLRKL